MKKVFFTIIAFLCCVSAYAQEASSILNEAITLEKKGKCDDAVPILYSMKLEEPNNPWIQYHLGKCLDNQSKFGTALFAYENLLRINPNFKNREEVEKRIDEIVNFLNQGQLLEVINTSLISDSTLTCKYYDYLFLKIKRSGKAENGIDLKAIYDRSEVLKKRDGLESCLTVDLAESFTSFNSMLLQALKLFDQKQYAEAIKLFEKTLNEWKTDPIVIKKVADTYLILNRLEAALWYYEEYLEVFKSAPDKKLILQKISNVSKKLKTENYLSLALFAVNVKRPVRAEYYFKQYSEMARKNNEFVDSESIVNLKKIVEYLGYKIIKIDVYPVDSTIDVKGADLIKNDLVSGSFEYYAIPGKLVSITVSQKGYSTIKDEQKVKNDGLVLNYILSENNYTASWTTFGISAAATTVAIILGAAAIAKSNANTKSMSNSEIESLNSDMQNLSISCDVLLPVGLTGIATSQLLRWVFDK